MDIIDTEKLALFHQQLSKIASDYEENWYLVKRIINEMEMDYEFENPFVIQELYEAQTKLERMMDVLNSLKNITSSLSQDYEDMIKRHQSTIEQMADYGQGLKAISGGLMKETHAQIVPVAYSYTAPVHLSIQKQFGQIEVQKDE